MSMTTRIDTTQLVKERLEPDKKTYGQGATRSADADETRYDLIPPCVLYTLARRFAVGAESHGDHNWKLGMPPSVIYNHLMRHLEMYRAGDTTDDHLGAALWGVGALIWYGERGETFFKEVKRKEAEQRPPQVTEMVPR